MNQLPIRNPDAAASDPRLEQVLHYVIAIGAVLVLLLPAARGMHAAIGWLPLWLLAMPMAALWALHHFRLPRGPQVDRPAIARVRRTVPQARRRARLPRREGLPRAA
ncbi:MAG: hypothetical protein ACREPE_05050 [Lysobacter sp.]